MKNSEQNHSPEMEIRLAEHFSSRFKDVYCISSLEMPETVKVKVANEEIYDDRFPAILDWDNGDEATLWYSRTAVEKKAEIYDDESHEIFAAIEKLYIAGSIGFGVLVHNIDPVDRDKVRLVYEELIKTTQLEKMIDEAAEFSDKDKANLKLSLLKLDEDRLVKLGVLRYAAGVYSFFADEDDTFEQLQRTATEDLQLTLRTRRMYSIIANANATSLKKREDAELVIDKIFTDATAEMSFALRFPMDYEEIRAIMTLAGTDKTSGTVGYNEVVVNDVEIGEGFHAE